MWVVSDIYLNSLGPVPGLGISGPLTTISEPELSESSSPGGASGSSASSTGLITVSETFGASKTIFSLASKVDWVEYVGSSEVLTSTVISSSDEDLSSSFSGGWMAVCGLCSANTPSEASDKCDSSSS